MNGPWIVNYLLSESFDEEPKFFSFFGSFFTGFEWLFFLLLRIIFGMSKTKIVISRAFPYFTLHTCSDIFNSLEIGIIDKRPEGMENEGIGI